MNNKNIININNDTENTEIYTLGKLLPQIFTNFIKDLKPRMIACFENLDDTLFNMAEKADSNSKQTVYFETMRTVRKSREQMLTVFFNSIQSTFQSFKKGEFNYFEADEKVNSDIKTVTLSLIDEKELDETLAKNNLINKSEMAYHRHIYAFKKRFSVLASGTEIKGPQVPISPHVIVNAYALCLKKIEINTTLKIIMYKLFERTIMGHLNEIYTQTNEFLITKGIVPEITYNIGRSGSQAQITTGNTQTNTPPENQEQPNQPISNTVASNTSNNAPQNQPYTDPNYQLISQLFSHNQPDFRVAQNPSQQSPQSNQGTPVNQTQNTNTHNNSNNTNIGMGPMLNALSILQGEIFQNTQNNSYNNQSPTEIKDEIIRQLHKLDSSTKDQNVKQQDEDTIDLIGMLFQFIVDDRNLPDAIQVLLARLQIPYLKIALNDRNVFADKKHPARKLLDKLSLESIGWSEESDKKGLYLSQVKQITQIILEMDEYTPDFFDGLLTDFIIFTSKQKKKSDVAQKRSSEKTLGQEKILQAKTKTAKILVDKMTNKQMPIVIRDLLLGEWSSVLVLMHLRHTKDSSEHLDKIKFVDDIIQYSRPSIDVLVTTDDIQRLSKQYKTGLNLVAFNPKDLIDKQHKLVKCLYKVHQLEHSDIRDDSSIEIINPEEVLKLSTVRGQHDIIEFIEEIIDPKHQDELEFIDDEYAQLVSSLKTGSWLEFIQGDNSAVRAKLSWISPITGKYLFVNARGLKISDKTDLSLASGLRNKLIRILQQVALFDRALSSIAEKMKKQGNNDSTTKTISE